MWLHMKITEMYWLTKKLDHLCELEMILCYIFIYLCLVQQIEVEEISLPFLSLSLAHCHYIERGGWPDSQKNLDVGPGCSEVGLSVGNLVVGDHHQAQVVVGHLVSPDTWHSRLAGCYSLTAAPPEVYSSCGLTCPSNPEVQHERELCGLKLALSRGDCPHSTASS